MDTRVFAGLLASLFLGGCTDPSAGQSAGNETPVADGRVVLVRNGKEVGAFVLRNQQFGPEVTDYAWHLRTDGAGTFASGDGAVKTGLVKRASSIVFGNFHVGWSGHSNRSGWVYYSKNAGRYHGPAKFEMCVTTETNVFGIDANDSRWEYRERPSLNVSEFFKAQVNR